MVMKFDPQGRVAFLLGRKAEAIQNPPRAGGPGGGGEGGGGRGGGAPGAGAQQDVFNRPTDVAWDAQGNIFVADGRGNNARVAKFSKDGVFVKSWGQKGTAPGQFASVDSIAVDAQGNVYAADGGNTRIQVFDNNGTFKTEIKNVGNAQAICITPGANQVIYVSNSNPPTDLDTAGEIYKMRLDGSMIGKFGRAGKLLKEFGTVNAIDCRSENTLYVGEVGNFRIRASRSIRRRGNSRSGIHSRRRSSGQLTGALNSRTFVLVFVLGPSDAPRAPSFRATALSLSGCRVRLGAADDDPGLSVPALRAERSARSSTCRRSATATVSQERRC